MAAAIAIVSHRRTENLEADPGVMIMAGNLAVPVSVTVVNAFEGWEQAVGDYAQDGYRSVADVVDPASLQKVRDHKKAAKVAAKAAAEPA